jgi:hypothetical protein
MAAAEATIEAAPAVEAKAEAKPEEKTSAIKNIALFLAAPFISIAYIVVMPFVGLGMLAWFAGKALAKHVKPLAPAAKTAAMLVASPFVGLAYIVAAPFIGLGLLVWYGAKALVKRS